MLDIQQLNDGRIVGRVSDLRDAVGDPNAEEVRYRCPYCPMVIGKEDRKGSFAFNRRRGRGMCFRCLSIITEDVFTDLDDSIREFLIRVGDLEETRKQDTIRKRHYTLSGWTWPAMRDLLACRYLLNRRITPAQMGRFNLRACETPVRGIVLPNRDLGDDKTDYFQVRDIDGDAWVKYLNPAKSSKPLYGADFLCGARQVFLCEGVFSAISATRYSGKVGAICTYGKSIKDDYLPEISDLPVREIWICYDGGEFWAALAAAHRVLRTGKRVRVVFLPYEKDPNDVPESVLRESVEFYSCNLTPSFTELLKMVYQRAGGKHGNRDSWDSVREEVRAVHG